MSLLRAPLLALGLGVLAFGQAATTPTKVGIINIQGAILQTKDGQKAAAELEAKFSPKRKELERKQGEVQAMETQYRAGANTMSEDAKQKLMRDMDARRKQLQRDMDDFNAESEAEQGKVLQELGQKIMAVIDKYATEHGFALILDVSSPQTPVLYASNSIEVTRDVVELYDKTQTGGAAAAPAAAKPAAAKPAAPAKK